MGDGIVLGRIGHYFDAGNGSCSTALVVEASGAADPGLDQPWRINVAAWNHDGTAFSRTSVPVDASPTTEAHENSFHLTRDCPWSR